VYFGTFGSTDGPFIFLVFVLTTANTRKQEDMSRAEELTTKLRTLSYDHERLMSMYRTETEKAANAEREMNLHKSRLAYVFLIDSQRYYHDAQFIYF
jgi:hypothetical protein